MDDREMRLPTLTDLSDIERAIKVCEAKLVIIDPFMAYLPGQVNSYRDQDVRRVLAPLSSLAEGTGAAVVVLRHLNKAVGVGNPLYRGGGSIGIIGAARSALLAAADPDSAPDTRRILAVTKSNLAALPPSLAYHIETNAQGIPVIVWEGESTHTARSLQSIVAEAERGSALTEAEEYLKTSLADGPKSCGELFREAKQLGIKEITLRRAKDKLRVTSKKEGYGNKGHWCWELPDPDI
jgi:RecA-family ATPase